MTTMEKHRRHSIRLRGYDYTHPGAYFITVCIEGKHCLLGEIKDDKMLLNEAGRMVETTWKAIPTQYPGVEIDAFVVMPNHIHGIIVLVGAPLVGARRKNDHAPPRATTRVAPTNILLGDVVGAFKSLTTDAYIHGVKIQDGHHFKDTSGNAIITNTSFVTRQRSNIFDNISQTTLPVGCSTAKTRQELAHE